MELEFIGNDFQGRIVHNFYEKDGSIGYYKGRLHGDTLIGKYKMLAEGMVSEIEKVYLKSGDFISEATGSLKENGSPDKIVFVSYDSIRFGAMKDFVKVDCHDDFISSDYDPYWKNLE